MRPDAAEYAPFYAGYVARVTEGGIAEVLAKQINEIEALVAGLPAERETHRYAPDKWSVREVLGHLIDAERVFGYRAFCISRGEAQPLPGFDENAYVSAADAHARPLTLLVEEWRLARQLNLMLFDGLSDDAWGRMGTASGQPVSVRALAYITAGHVDHHLAVLRARYGID